MSSPHVIHAIAALALATSACAKDAERTPQQRPDSSANHTGAVATSVQDSSAAPPAPATPSSTAPEPAARSYTVSEQGIGPLRAGMTFAAADSALGGALLVPAGVDTSGCDYLVWDKGPPGVQVMFDQHHVARVDVDTASIATSVGARVGDDEATIKRLYPGQVTVTPHKYEDGHYLTVTPRGADKRFRIVFETAGGRVTRYRAGIMPSVEYIEGCS